MTARIPSPRQMGAGTFIGWGDSGYPHHRGCLYSRKTTTKTLRERLFKTEQQECWRCHKKMNPLGYAFEMYDDFGRYRTAEKLTKGGTKPVNANGELTGTGEKNVDGDVKNALELIHKLAQSDKVRQNMIRHVFRYLWAERNAHRFKNTNRRRSGLSGKWWKF